MLKWKKLGLVFDPSKESTHPWMSEYAQIPFPFQVDDETVRIYFATRPKRGSDMQYVSRSAYVEVDANDITHVKKICDQPIFDLGGPGTFDEFGSMTSSFVRVGDEIYSYYTGWSRCFTVPYSMANGLAISKNGGITFERVSDGPLMGATINEPFLLSGPIVRVIDGVWHMWYLNGYKWLHHNSKYEPVYRLAHATSSDGIDWKRNGIPVIPAVFENECQVGFALFRHNDLWNVIFAYRKPLDFREKGNEGAYRLGYAYSHDLETWHRDDSQVGITISDEGWDSEMMAYPQVGAINGNIYLFYCGNNFGFGGFGAAILEV